MSMDERIERIVSSYLATTFAFNVIIDLTDNTCIGLRQNRLEMDPMTFEDVQRQAISTAHPLFIGRLRREMDVQNLKQAYDSMRTIRFEALMKYAVDNEYHWYRVRFTPIADGTGHMIFLFNALPIDDDVRAKAETQTQTFNRTVLRQLLYNYLLVYVIDLSNGMSRLVYSNEGDEYDDYAKGFDEHKDMMEDLMKNYISDDFYSSFKKMYDYDYIKEQLKNKDRLVLIFRDKKNIAYEINITKYPQYDDEEYPIVIFALKTIS